MTRRDLPDLPEEFPRYDAEGAARAATQFHRELWRAAHIAGVRPTDEDAYENAVEQARSLIGAAEDVLVAAVELDRFRGCSWATIGERLGISRQAAHERFADRVAT